MTLLYVHTSIHHFIASLGLRNATDSLEVKWLKGVRDIPSQEHRKHNGLGKIKWKSLRIYTVKAV